jgi:DNA-binding CsgD family transcriptional regulator
MSSMDHVDMDLDRITIVPDLQPRVAGLDEEHMRALQEASESWPPLVVVQQGNAVVLVDGYHRYAAAQNLGLSRVPVRVVPPPPDGDLHALAFALNAVHGRPLTLTDRRAEAERLLSHGPEVSNMEVSRRAGLSPTTIAALRTRLEEEAKITPAPERVGADGTRYPAIPSRSERAAGELPEQGFGDLVGQTVGRLFTSEERRQQRQVASYFKRLAVALEDGDDLAGWETADDAAEACVLVLGKDEAADLGERLGHTSANVYDVARALGYDDEDLA